MKLDYDTTKDHKYIRRFTHDFLSRRKGEELDCMQAMRKCIDAYGIRIDHHEWAYTLDYMRSIGEASFIRSNGGFTVYIIE